jgi:methionyl-tRNA formyltransferase
VRQRTPSPDGRARIVFLGSGDFAVPILEALLEDPRADVVGVVSAPDRTAGRGSAVRATPVARCAGALGLVLLQPVRLRAPESVAALLELRPELGVLADYGQIVPGAVLDAIPHGMLNLHPSLLPRHRGATPIPAAILAGDWQTGVSLFLMDAGLDSGPLVSTSVEALDGTETTPDLEARLARSAAALISSKVNPWLQGELEARAQPPDGMTLTRPLRRGDGRLDPSRPASLLERQVRAYLGWPGSYLETRAGRLVVHAATVGPGRPEPAGSIGAAGDGLALVTSDGSLVLDDVQLAGGRPMTGAALVRGHPGVLGPPPD